MMMMMMSANLTTVCEAETGAEAKVRRRYKVQNAEIINPEAGGQTQNRSQIEATKAAVHRKQTNRTQETTVTAETAWQEAQQQPLNSLGRNG